MKPYDLGEAHQADMTRPITIVGAVKQGIFISPPGTQQAIEELGIHETLQKGAHDG
jgi:hypothetical protein